MCAGAELLDEYPKRHRDITKVPYFHTISAKVLLFEYFFTSLTVQNDFSNGSGQTRGAHGKDQCRQLQQLQNHLLRYYRCFSLPQCCGRISFGVYTRKSKKRDPTGGGTAPVPICTAVYLTV